MYSLIKSKLFLLYKIEIQPAEVILDGSAYLCFSNSSLNTLRCYFNFGTIMIIIYFDAQMMMVCWQRTLAGWLLCMAN